MKELVEVIAKALVDEPESVVVKEVEGDKSTVIELRVANNCLGNIIGKRGRNIQSIRTIVNAAAAKLNKRVMLDVIE
ncbi:MAG: KH domain-containing protein [Deltaproteobacteria bacterium]|nr:KH domain-containing protein [Deltaproteobacteria bacterium]MBN2671998.1 KH domain-containing protein [Deltaproteobacteria bacterium]